VARALVAAFALRAAYEPAALLLLAVRAEAQLTGVALATAAAFAAAIGAQSHRGATASARALDREPQLLLLRWLRIKRVLKVVQCSDGVFDSAQCARDRRIGSRGG